MATNPYKDVYQQACLLTDSFPKETIDNAREITLDEAVAIVTRCQKQFEELASKKEALQKSLEEAESSLGKISHFSELDYDISSILHFKFIKFRFGRISREYYDKFYNYVYDSVDTVLYRCDEDQAERPGKSRTQPGESFFPNFCMNKPDEIGGNDNEHHVEHYSHPVVAKTF